MTKIKAGIVGSAGYTGGELLRLLIFHPHVELSFAQSNSNADKPIHSVHSDLLGETELMFSSEHNTDVDVIFLCGGHGAAQKFMSNNPLPPQLTVIDLSHDFRHAETRQIGDRTFVYGLPEVNRSAIAQSKSIANPGCFATCIQLALLPLAANGKLHNNVHINATTGSTGAGQSLSNTTHFSWRSNNLSIYKPFDHQHLKEIGETLLTLQPELNSELLFIPQRGSFTRGILTTAYLPSDLDKVQAVALYKDYYDAHPFVQISEQDIDLKQVLNTNRCFINITAHNGNLLITSVIDNLLKGASGQAVQNMNLIFGFNETAGLQLKPSAF